MKYHVILWTKHISKEYVDQLLEVTTHECMILALDILTREMIKLNRLIGFKSRITIEKVK
jgi:hypothetical protein